MDCLFSDVGGHYVLLLQARETFAAEYFLDAAVIEPIFYGYFGIFGLGFHRKFVFANLTL